MVADIVAGAVLAVFSAFGFWQAHRLWPDPGYVDRMMLFNSVLPFRREVRRGAVRGTYPLAAMLGFAAAVVVVVGVSRPVPGHPNGGAIVAVVFLGLMVVALTLHVSIIWFNRPLWLVPPHMRSDRGSMLARRHRDGTKTARGSLRILQAGSA